MREILSKIFTKAATYPVAAALCFLAGIFAVYWISGAVAANSEYKRAKAEYNAKTAANDKAFQAALSKAAEAAERSRKAETEAAAIIKANSEKASGQTKKDAALDAAINQTLEEGKIKNEKIKNDFDNDMRRIDAMPDEQRAADICERIKQLAAANPQLASYQCEANAANANANANVAGN